MTFVIYAPPRDISVSIPSNASEEYVLRVWGNLASQGYVHKWSDCGAEYFEHTQDGTRADITMAAA